MVPQKQATAISVYYVFGYVMTAVLPLISNAWSVQVVLWMMTILCSVSVVTFVLLRKG